MDKRNRWSRILVIVGFVAMLAGLIDPLEGSLVILAGAILLAVGAHLGGGRHKKLIMWSFALVAVGVGAMWWLSALGGVGGGSGRSYWWALVVVPYPVGWVTGVIGAILRLREGRRALKKPEAQ